MTIDMAAAAKRPQIGHVVHVTTSEQRLDMVCLEAARAFALDTSESVSLETGLPSRRP